jgi:KaiC/GvpD/RAD55 family RecA-like ATPase
LKGLQRQQKRSFEMDTVEKMLEVKIPPIDPNQIKDFLIAKPANQWIDEAKTRSVPNMLFSELWHEGELCILYASTGAGKTILAYQIGDSISKGINIPGFKNESSSQIVLYCDWELSDKQFEQRYSENFENHYLFDEKFIRIELNPEADKPEKQTEEEYLMYSIERCIEEYGAKILIVDNITYLRSDTERAKDALPLMKKLKSLKKKYDLSILALAHTPKRDVSKPITRNDLSGSVMLINFCDSSFAIGFCNTDPNLRYIKQIKERFTEDIYGEDNVIVCQTEKNVNFLQFSFLNFGLEADYLKTISETDKEEIESVVFQRHREGKSYRIIANELKISHSKVQRIIKKRNESVPF